MERLAGRLKKAHQAGKLDVASKKVVAKEPKKQKENQQQRGGLAAAVEPPLCKRIPHEMTHHGITRNDPYHWLRHKKNPAVRRYLKHENRYADWFLHETTGELKESLFTEMRKRWKETDTSLPTKDRNFWYYSRSVEGLDHPVHCRLPYKGHENLLYDFAELLSHDPDALLPKHHEEVIVLDLNKMARMEMVPNLELGDLDVSPDERHVVLTVDLSDGAEEYTVLVLKIEEEGDESEEEDGEEDDTTAVDDDDDDDDIEEVPQYSVRELRRIAGPIASEIVWGTDSTIIYFEHDSSQRAYRVMRLKWEDRQSTAELLFEENDEQFNLCALCSTDDEKFLSFHSEGKTSCEVLVMPKATSDTAPLRTLVPKKSLFEYEVCHHSAFMRGPDGSDDLRPAWLLCHNGSGCDNFRIDFIMDFDIADVSEEPMIAGEPSTWRPLVRYDPLIKIDSVDASRRFVLVSARSNGLPQTYVISMDDVRKLLEDGSPLATAGLSLSEHFTTASALLAASNFGGDDGAAAGEVFDAVDGAIAEDFESTAFRVTVANFTQPTQEYEIPFGGAAAGAPKPRLLRKDAIRGPYDADDYAVERVWARASMTAPSTPIDGQDHSVPRSPVVQPDSSGNVDVPIFLCYRKDKFVKGTNPVVLYVYGSYGDPTDPDFDSHRISLLDRGVVLGFALVRGGGELGRLWRNSGRMEHRMNSVTDFVACAKFLLDAGYAAPNQLIARGGSAGGSVVAAAANAAPHLFNGVCALVPFVDCLTTLLDPSLPLTTAEWDEFGNPLAHPSAFRAIQAYSPTDNVTALLPGIRGPHWYVESSWGDPRVPYWEPAALVARLRHRHVEAPDNTEAEGVEEEEVDDDVEDYEEEEEPWIGPEGGTVAEEAFILHKCSLDAGHGGATGRYSQLWEIAAEYAFTLWCCGRHTESLKVQKNKKQKK